MSRHEKRRHYEAALASANGSVGNAVRLGAWSNYTAGYQVTLIPRDCPIIIKTKQTDPAGNLFAAMDKWAAFSRRYFRLRPDLHAAYFVDASALFSGPPAAAASPSNPSSAAAAAAAAAAASMERREMSQTTSLGEAARPIRNVISKLNPRGATLVAAGGVPGIILFKLCAFNNISIWHEVVRRVVLFLPAEPTQWDPALLRGMCNAVLQHNAKAGGGTPLLTPVAELCVVVSSEQEMRRWLDVQTVSPLLHSFIVKMFAAVRVECLPAVGGGNPLVHFANILCPGAAPDLATALPPNRVQDVSTYEIKFQLSKFSKQVEQEVDALTLESGAEGWSGNGALDEEEDEGDDDEEAVGSGAGSASAAAAVLQDDGVSTDVGDKTNSAAPAAAAAASAARPAAAVSSASPPLQQQQPLQLINADLTHLSVPTLGAAAHVPVRLSGFVLDSDAGAVANAHGLFNIDVASANGGNNVLQSFEGKAVKLVADLSLDETGHVLLRNPRQVLRVPQPEKEALLVPNSVFSSYAALADGQASSSSGASVPLLSSISGVTREYGCVLVRGRKVALVRKRASDAFLRFPAAARRSLAETPQQCASRAVCELLDVLPDQFAIVGDIPPVVVYRRERSLLLGTSETVVTTLFIAVTAAAAAGGAARDAVEEELCTEDSYDWVAASQAEALLEHDEERTALRDAAGLLRRAVAAALLAWPAGYGMLGDAVKAGNDALTVFVHCPFLDVSSEESAKAISNLVVGAGDAAASKVVSVAGSKYASDPAAMAKQIAKAGARITCVPCPPSLSFEYAVFDVAPAVKKRNWAEARQVTVLTASRRVLAAFDGTETDVGVVSVAEDILEHSDDIVVVAAAAATAAGASSGADGSSKAAASAAASGDEAEETAQILLALLQARKNESTAVWRASAPVTATSPFAGPGFVARLLRGASAAAAAPQQTAWMHPRVVVVRPVPKRACAGGAATPAVMPLNPNALLNLTTEEALNDVVKPLRLVHVRGTAWVAGCPTSSVRIALRGGTDWSFARAQPFEGSPGHDIELVFCPASDGTAAAATAFWQSLLCANDAEVQAFADESALEELPGWAHEHGENEEEEEGDEDDE